MKQSLKLKSLVLALGLAGGMHTAGAAILYTDTNGVPAAGGAGDANGSSFLFFAFDGVGKSYIKAINFRMGDVNTQTTPIAFSLPGLASFFTGSADAQWSVYAADTANSGQGTYKGYGFSTGLATDLIDDVSLNNAGTKQSALTFKDLINAADAEAPAHSAGDVLTSLDAGDAWNAANFSMNQGGSSLANLADASTLFAWNIVAAGNTLGGASTRTLLAYNWSLDLTGNQLNFATPPPAPVPVPAAAWLLGSALATVVGVRRRRQTPAAAV